MLCFTTDTTLHVVDGYGANPFVLSFIDRLRRSGIKPTIVYVTPEALKSLYGRTAVTDDRGQTGRGKAAFSGKFRHEQVVALLRNATQAGASDIHFFASPNGHHVRYRVHGELETVQSFVGSDGEQMMSTIYETMSESTDNSYRPSEKQDGRLKSEFVTECGLFGARIATRPSLNGPWMALRLLYDSGKQLSLGEMGYLPSQIDQLTRLVHRKDGLVLLTGTTGSGKSTSIQTLLSMLMEAMENTINLVSVEDPVEYRIAGSNQTPLGPKEQWDQAITNLMRLDPDVLLVGEIRDRASVLAAIQAVLTGHGTWSTLHVNAAAASFQRLSDLGVEDNLLYDPALIKGLVNQSLTRVLCPHCKTPYLPRRQEVASDVRERIESLCIPEQVYLKGSGCAHCRGRGVINRTAIAEIILPDLPFMRTFRDQGKAEAQVFWVREQGGITKNAHLIHRINEGLVDPTHGERDVCQLDEDRMTLGAGS
jgi:type II secretory ATPase GspE/PulE/Tfp pilus assembly ATPase PilB-like protein